MCDERLTGTWLFQHSVGSNTFYMTAQVTRDCATVDVNLIHLIPGKTGLQKITYQLLATFTELNGLTFINVNVVGDAEGVNFLVRYDWDKHNRLRAFLVRDQAFKTAIKSGDIKGHIRSDHKDGFYTLEPNDPASLAYMGRHAERLVGDEVLLLRLSTQVYSTVYAWPSFE